MEQWEPGESRGSRRDLRAAGGEIPSADSTTARSLGGKFSIVTFDKSLSPALRARAEFHGMGDLLHAVEVVSDSSSFDAADVQINGFEAINALCVSSAKEPISSIVMGGGPLAGLSSRIRTFPRIPVIDGTQAAIGMLRSAIHQ